MVDDILTILNEIEAEENAREARRRGYVRIREVILEFREIEAKIESLKGHAAAAQKDHDEIVARLTDTVNSLRSQVREERVALEKEKGELEQERRKAHAQRNELNAASLRAQKQCDEILRNCAAKEIEAKEKLAAAIQAYEDFKAKMVAA